jgi:hypothetical protein
MAKSKEKLRIQVNRIGGATASFARTTTPSRNQVLVPEQFRNIGFPGILVAVFVSSFFAAQIACDVTVLLLYGWHAFFAEGLRVADWKHSILSNGARLPWWGTLMMARPRCLLAY